MTPNEYQKEALRTASGMSQEYPRILNGLMGLNVLYAKKNHDYGDSFHQTYIEEGMAMPRIRLGDKFSRFKTLSRILSSDSDQQAVTDESIRDTLLDLANYSIMTVLEIDDAQHEQEIAEQKTCDEGASDAD